MCMRVRACLASTRERQELYEPTPAAVFASLPPSLVTTVHGSHKTCFYHLQFKPVAHEGALLHEAAAACL